MEKPVITALASFGMSGQVFHGPSIKVNSRFKLAKILERTKNLSAIKYPESTIVRTYNEILNDPEVELVIVNTPDHLHYDMVKQALEAGKHVVTEKPFTRTTQEALTLIDLARSKNLILTVYQNRRLDGDFLTVNKVLDSGVLGRLVEFESHFDRYRNFIQENTWKEEGDERAGVLFNLGSHMLDQALVLFGSPYAVTAHLGINRTGGVVTDYYDIRLHYDNFNALIKCSYLVREQGPRYTLHGTEGSFLKWGIDPQEEMLKEGHLPNESGWGSEPESDWGKINSNINGLNIKGKIETIPGNYTVFYDNLYEAIRNNGELMVKPEEAMNIIALLETCLISNREGKTISFK